ncbi:nuclear hormone receptor HR96-like isoform X2 [Physella acuta]|uniref:nuclear hormone receptor HR96-like isoform X2 n=1 Tax=Physella acuta TaxID=109671 RepID=UPI0027DDFAF6|nr:nuclear hormone receptor HR96-like isoform X2 [Physella acuta]
MTEFSPPSQFPVRWLENFYNYTPHSYLSMWEKTSWSPPPKSGSQSKREQKRRPKPKDGTMLFCGVCGDRALGYNFDAISCESCKAFFRRNALKAKPFTCSFEGNCKLDAHTRKFCSGCRLKKCFSIGMKKEWILNEDQLVKRRQRQQTRQLQQSPGGGSNSEIQPCSSTSNDLMGEDSGMSYLHPGQLPLPRHPHLMSTGQNGGDSDFMTLNPYYDSRSSSTSPLKRHYMSFDGSASPTSTSSPPSHIPHHMAPLMPNPPLPHLRTHTLEPVTKIPKVEYSSDEDDYYYGSASNSVNPLSETVCSSDELTNSSFVKSEISDPVEENEDYSIPLHPQIDSSLKELSKIYDEIFEAAYTPDQVPKLTEKPKTASQLFNMTDIFIRRLIRFAKHIPEFKSLSQTDQIHLLKGGIMEMFVLRSAMGFDSKSNGFKFKMLQGSNPDAPKLEGKVDSSVINSTLGSSMFIQHITFVRQLLEVSGKDRTVLMLLFIIELMSPDRAHLVETKQVMQSQKRHSMWLKAYLESVHTVAKANAVYPKLLEKLQDVRNLGQESCQMASHLDITNLEPLLVEVFDLNR